MSTPTATKATPAHFAELNAALSPLFIDRDKALSLMYLALVAKVHVFMISKPGTAKSMLVTELMKRLYGARSFSCLFDKEEAKDLVFGPVSVPSLVEGKRRREYAGYAPDVDVFFADEIWKGSEAASNSMLELINERRFLDGNVKIDIPLWTMFAASNELPDPANNNLAAIYDRVDLRLWVDQITDPQQKLALLRLPEPDPNPAPVMHWDTVKDAHAQAMALPIADGVFEAYIAIQAAVAPLELSGRRQRVGMRIAKANAWLRGADEVRVEHLDFLMHFLWHQPEQRHDVAVKVLEAAAPGRARAIAVSEQVATIISGLRQALTLEEGSDERDLAAMELDRKLKRAANEAYTLEQELTGLALEEVNRTWEDIDRVYRQVQREMFNQEPSDIGDVQARARAGQYARN